MARSPLSSVTDPHEMRLRVRRFPHIHAHTRETGMYGNNPAVERAAGKLEDPHPPEDETHAHAREPLPQDRHHVRGKPGHLSRGCERRGVPSEVAAGF